MVDLAMGGFFLHMNLATSDQLSSTHARPVTRQMAVGGSLSTSKGLRRENRTATDWYICEHVLEASC